MQTKICNKCNQEKPIEDFPKRPKTEKYYGTCKECKKEYAKIYRAQNASSISERRKKKYNDNIEAMREKGREYYANHKEEVNARNKAYYEKNSKELNAKSRAYYKDHAEEIKEQKKVYNAEHQQEQRTWRKNYYQENTEKIAEYQKQYRKNNADKIQEYMDEYRTTNAETLKEKRKQYNAEHKEDIKKRNAEYSREHISELREYREKYRRQRMQNDPMFKLSVNIRHLISNSLRRQGFSKKTRTYEILGCDYDTFYRYMLETYKNNYGVEWDGKEEVHIDHIIPLATAESEEEIIKLCHYTNLQLLKAKDNLEKRDKIDWVLDFK